MIARWNALKPHLSDEQRAPMEELLRLVGLKRVKNAAISIYADMLANERLRRDGYDKAVTPRTLNFVFSGNPGECCRRHGERL